MAKVNVKAGRLIKSHQLKLVAPGCIGQADYLVDFG